MLEVLDAGLLTTVQDGGRPGLGALGVPEGGAADRRSLAIANLLLGGPSDAPALEATLLGPTLRVLEPITVALAGADLGAHVIETGKRVAPGAALPLQAGQTISLPGPAVGGVRAYLAVAGGLVVTPVLGSAATLLGAGFGGLGGRALRAGDILEARVGRESGTARWPGAASPRSRTGMPLLRIAPGPHVGGVGDARLAALAASAWTVDPRSDRMGLRLDGPPLSGSWTGEMATIGVLPGAVQVPPDGRPIALLVDAQPTGGYRVVATVIAADLPLLGQLGPGDVLRFAVVTADEARALLRADREAFDMAAAHLREAAGWDELWRGAGG